jgi:hypothetical protein
MRHQLYLVLLFILLHSALFSQTEAVPFKFPSIRTEGVKIADFIPTDWELRKDIYNSSTIDSVNCDFNVDGLMDIAFVIQTIKPVEINDTICFSREKYHPKVLVILFRQNDNSFKLVCYNYKLFGECNWGVRGSDPFRMLLVRRNTLGLSLETGGTNRDYFTYYFQFKKNDWFLIGAEESQWHPPDIDSYEVNVNYLTNEREEYSLSGGTEVGTGKRSDYKKTFIKQMPLIKLSEFENDSDIQLDSK